MNRSLTFTWREDGQPDVVWALSSEAIESLDKFRLTIRDTIVPQDGGPPRHQLRFSDVKDMVRGILNGALIVPAFALHPPPSLVAASQAAQEAQAAYEAAHAAAQEAAMAGEVVPATTLTKFQFRSLFTFDELVAVDNYTTNETLSGGQKAQVRTVLANFEAAQDISLTDSATQAGVNLLAEVGLLTAERAAMILSGTAPTTP